MKVKEFVKQFRSDVDEGEFEEALQALVKSFFGEFNRKLEERNISARSSRDVWVPLLDEMDNQWHKIAEELHGVKEKGFQNLMFSRHPDLKEVWTPKKQ